MFFNKKDCKKIDISNITIVKENANEAKNKDLHILSFDIAKTPSSDSDKEYIWVDIYKGTNSEMNCMNDFHYELDHIYTIEDEKELTICGYGFNCCLKLSDVFYYKPFSFVDPNRYFKGSALVLKKDYENYGHPSNYGKVIDKLVAKSIVLKEEMPIEEIYKTFNFTIGNVVNGYIRSFSISCENFSFEDFRYCFENKIDCYDFLNTKFVKELSKLDFSETFKIIISEKYTNKNKLINYKNFINFIQSLFDEGISVDMRTYLILKEIEK